MELNQYPKDELQTLLIGISVAKEYAKKIDGVFVFNQLDKWADRINEAISDASIQESALPFPPYTVKINYRKYEFDCPIEAYKFANYWGVQSVN